MKCPEIAINRFLFLHSICSVSQPVLNVIKWCLWTRICAPPTLMSVTWLWIHFELNLNHSGRIHALRPNSSMPTNQDAQRKLVPFTHIPLNFCYPRTCSSTWFNYLLWHLSPYTHHPPVEKVSPQDYINSYPSHLKHMSSQTERSVWTSSWLNVWLLFSFGECNYVVPCNCNHWCTVALVGS